MRHLFYIFFPLAIVLCECGDNIQADFICNIHSLFVLTSPPRAIQNLRRNVDCKHRYRCLIQAKHMLLSEKEHCLSMPSFPFCNGTQRISLPSSSSFFGPFGIYRNTNIFFQFNAVWTVLVPHVGSAQNITYHINIASNARGKPFWARDIFATTEWKEKKIMWQSFFRQLRYYSAICISSPIHFQCESFFPAG